MADPSYSFGNGMEQSSHTAAQSWKPAAPPAFSSVQHDPNTVLALLHYQTSTHLPAMQRELIGIARQVEAIRHDLLVLKGAVLREGDSTSKGNDRLGGLGGR